MDVAGLGEEISNEDMSTTEVDVLIPPALGAALHSGNAEAIGAKIVVEAANFPVMPTLT